jgi:hypothetical protein
LADTTAPNNSPPSSLPDSAAPRPRRGDIWATLIVVGVWALKRVAATYIPQNFDVPIPFQYLIGVTRFAVDIAVILLAIRLTGVPARDYLGLVRLRPRTIALAVCGGMVAWVLEHFLQQVVLPHLGLGPVTNVIEFPLSDIAKAFVIAQVVMVYVVVAPIAEEMFFRGL